jgi:hypothetical protein
LSGTAFADPPLVKDQSASGIAPGENSSRIPSPTHLPPRKFETPKESAPGQIIGPDDPGETDEQTPGQEGVESGIIGPD